MRILLTEGVSEGRTPGPTPSEDAEGSAAAGPTGPALRAALLRAALAAALAAAALGVAAAARAARAAGHSRVQLRQRVQGAAVGLRRGDVLRPEGGDVMWRPYNAGSCACRASCSRGGGGPCPAFPEVDYVYVPELPEDVARFAPFTAELDEHVPCGSAGVVRKVPGVYPLGWGRGRGRLDVVRRFAARVPPVAPGTVIAAAEGMLPVREPAPWWARHNVAYAETYANGTSVWAARSPELAHHSGCSLSHFIAWMGALERGAPHMILAESDALLSVWWAQHVGGPAAEFAGVVQALLEEAPEGWDVVMLDKGIAGVEPGTPPAIRLTRECWSNEYDVYPWAGAGQAGATLYLVSGRFLRKVPQLIHDVGLDMVDGWLGARCNAKVPWGGQLRCFSLLASPLPEIVRLPPLHWSHAGGERGAAHDGDGVRARSS